VYGALAAIAVASLAGCARQTDLELTLRFRNAEGLVAGDDVRIDDLRVGEVQRIDAATDRADVHVIIHARYRKRATEDALFVLKPDGAQSSRRYIVLQPGTGAPLATGAVMAGKESGFGGFSDWASQTADLLQDSELRSRWSEFARAAQTAAEKGIAAWEASKPELEAAAREFYDWVLREAPEWAAEIRKAIVGLLQRVEQDLRERGA
jgi:hypothetical protein